MKRCFSREEIGGRIVEHSGSEKDSMVLVVVIVRNRRRSRKPELLELVVMVICGGDGGSGRDVVKVKGERRGEVSLSFDATEETGGAIVSESSFFGSVESA